MVLQPSLSDLSEFLGTWDEDLLVFKTSGLLSVVLSFLQTFELVVVFSEEDIDLVTVSVSFLVQLVSLAVESSSVVDDFGTDISDLGLASVFWEQNLLLHTNQVLSVGIVLETFLDSEEFLVLQTFTGSIKLNTLGDLVLMVS